MQDITVLGEYVLVKQTMTKKKSVVILTGGRKNEDKFDYKFELLQKGDECKRKIEIGDSPIFGQHVQFQVVKVLEHTEERMISLLIVHESDIIGIDNSLSKGKPQDSEPEMKIIHESN